MGISTSLPAAGPELALAKRGSVPLTRAVSSEEEAARIRYNTVTIDSCGGSPETEKEVHQSCALLVEAIQLRSKYLWRPASERTAAGATDAAPAPAVGGAGDGGEGPKCVVGVDHEASVSAFDLSRLADVRAFEMRHGIAVLLGTGDEAASGGLCPVPSLEEHLRDYKRLLKIVNDGGVRSVSYSRLRELEYLFNMHESLNGALEDHASGTGDTMDFYCVHKVDTHVHLAAAFNPHRFVNYMRDKIVHHGDDVVLNGKTLTEVTRELGIVADDLNVDTSDLQGDKSLFHRFDRFNDKYNPAGAKSLRSVFLKTENDIGGRYLAELTRDRLSSLEKVRTVHTEYRVSIYGGSSSEWDDLSRWMVTYDLFSPANRWMIQVPRIYRVLRRIGKVTNFAEVLSNIFVPLFEVTLDPASHPELATVLPHVSGFDSVDDESVLDQPFQAVPADEWDSEASPSYAYQLYHMWANLVVLNRLREARGLNTFQLRPHCGEAGDPMHLATAYMLADSISHGINLDLSVSLQYLYYLSQVGCAVSPVSNNFLFLRLDKNPFPKFFKRGLNVSLSTDDPMLFHLQDISLIEEYAVARVAWRLSITDLSEIARNSVLHSGFGHETKKAWLGPNYLSIGPKSNDPNKTNVPMIRAMFRWTTLENEATFLTCAAGVPDVLGAVVRGAELSRPIPVSDGHMDVGLGGGEDAFGPLDEFTAGANIRVARAIEAGDPDAAAKDLSAAGVDVQYNRVLHELTSADNLEETQKACKRLIEALDLRKKYVDARIPHAELPEEVETTFVHGVMVVTAGGSGGAGGRAGTTAAGDNLVPVPSLEEFRADYETMVALSTNGSVKTLAYRRLRDLQSRFDMHTAMNTHLEKVGGMRTDFYTVRKVDNHVHLAAAASPRKMLSFMRKKMLRHSYDVVHEGKTLASIVKSLKLDPRTLTVDALDVQGGFSLFKRFDRFNAKYNPMGEAVLRTVFLKTQNDIGGRYFAELTRDQLTVLENMPGHIHAEYRISVYGTAADEWKGLADWASRFDLFSSNNVWMVQVPRIYRIIKKSGAISCYQDLLDNIFKPLFDATLHPEDHPLLARFLLQMSGFDSVDDESLLDADFTAVPPEEWSAAHNPPYQYELYFLWANIKVLNELRASRGMNTFCLRPHSGESGQSMHLAASWLTAASINHGINLRSEPGLQYLYYLAQVGISMSPVSNNMLFLAIKDSPFLKLFKRGLNVTLSTDDPMFFHLTEESLLEEYAIARHIWRLSITDLSEIARNSVLQSGFPDKVKREWLGADFDSPGVESNNPHFTNVPMVRASFRWENHKNELDFVQALASTGRNPKSGLDAARVRELEARVAELEAQLKERGAAPEE